MEEISNPLDGFWMEGDSLAPPCQAEDDVINSILDVASLYLEKGKKFCDLGCGDGRICIKASEYFGCKSIGCEIEESLAREFLNNVKEKGLEDLVTVVHGDLQELDLADLDVILTYLLPESIKLIEDKLIDSIKRGSVVICNTWGIKSLKPKSQIITGEAKSTPIYLYDKSSIPLLI